jgi:hypothetical protein
MVQCELANFQDLDTYSIEILIARISTVTLENLSSILVINMSRTTNQDYMSGEPGGKPVATSARCTLHITE